MTVLEVRMPGFLGAIGAFLIWIISPRHSPAKTPAQEKLAPRRLNREQPMIAKSVERLSHVHFPGHIGKSKAGAAQRNAWPPPATPV